MKPEEVLVLYTIGTGASNVKEIFFKSSLGSKQLHRVLEGLLRGRFVTKSPSGVSLSNIGLLELSRFFYRKQCRKTEYSCSFRGQSPYLVYKNDFKKDIIFHPQLYFDPACPFDDWNKELVYEITFEEYKFDLNILEVMHNLLYEYESFHPTGFWILKCVEKSMCGYGIESLRQTLSLAGNTIALCFVLAFQNFIVLAKSVDQRVADNLRVKIYLTRDTDPYIDTLDSLHDTLKVLWSFLGISGIPKGREIELEPKIPERLPIKPIQFVPQICGKIIWKDKTNIPHEIDPFIIAFDPSNINTSLSKVSPWLATCSGGFIEEDFTEKREFGILNFNVLNLPDIDIVGIILSAGHFSPDLHRKQA